MTNGCLNDCAVPSSIECEGWRCPNVRMSNAKCSNHVGCILDTYYGWSWCHESYLCRWERKRCLCIPSTSHGHKFCCTDNERIKDVHINSSSSHQFWVAEALVTDKKTFAFRRKVSIKSPFFAHTWIEDLEHFNNKSSWTKDGGKEIE